ncbi:MAG: hypothetical protein HY720_05685, partial [Planctomycetes bacterium]|nr:hypothetical protein [Planctomycetota bacterium]
MDFEHACASHRSSLGEFALPGAEKHYPPDLEIEPVHLDIALALDLVARSAAGTVTVSVEGRRAGPMSLALDAIAFEDLSVRDAEGREIRWSYDGKKIDVHWEESFARGERRRLAVSYRVVRPASGLFFCAPTEAYPGEPWFAATDHETERARFWLPTVDLPCVRSRLDFHLTAEARFTILANGTLVSEDRHADGTKTAHWRLESPCPSYLTCFAVGEFVRADDGEFEGIPIVYFAPPPFSPADLLRSFGRTREMLAWMTKKLDHPFPYPKYFQFALPGFGGAMENISLVSWDDCFVLDETLAREWGPRVDLVNLHEMAHSYFGDLVVCRDFAHAWLKESWATYMEECWLEDAKGEEERRYHSYRHAKAYFQEADDKYKRPIVTREFSSSWDLYDRHLYPGGACRLHTLRCELGDDVFWPAVADYVRTYAGKTVETDDFRRILEARSGRSLGRFFDEWFHTAGYPFLKVSFEHDAKKKEGTFKIEQAQVDEKAGVPAFHLAIELAWTAGEATETLAVALDKARETVVVPMEKDPDSVRVD